MKQPTASTVERLVHCSASHILPQTETFSLAAEGGTDKHEAHAAAINGRQTTASQEALALLNAVDWHRVYGGAGMLEAETAYVIDVQRNVLIPLGKDIGRRYEKALNRKLRKYELPMSIDVEGLREGVPWCRDLKFGITSNEWQLRVHAMALVLKYPGTVEVDTGFAFIDPGTGFVRNEEHRYYVHELDEWRQQLVDAWDYADSWGRTAGDNTHEGPWCQYCGALPHCPSKMKMVRAIGELDGVDEKLGAMTPEQRGRVWARVKDYERLLKRIEEALKDIAAVQPLPLPNGKVIELRKVNGYEYPGKHEALALLRQLGATEEQIKSVMKRKADHMRAMEVVP